MKTIGRRDFLKWSAAAGAVAALPPPVTAKMVNGIPYRTLGKVGVEVSLLGIGGGHIGDAKLPESEAIRIMRTAVDEGINFFDNAWEYSRGASEERMGKALRDGYREKVFLMTKVLARSREGAQKQLETSLTRLQVDYLDLWQVHSVGTFSPGDPGKVYDNGVLDVALKAREEGKVKHIGFTGHRHPEIHLEVIERGFDWETIQMPLNCLDPHHFSFVQNVLPKAVEKGYGVIAMKTLAGGELLRAGNVTAAEALRYSMSLPISVLVSGMDSFDKFMANLEVARSFEPMPPEEIAALLARTRGLGADGAFEPYKEKRV